MRFTLLLASSLTLTTVHASSDDELGHDDHDHDEHGHGAIFEWAGTFETPDDVYIWTSQNTDGKYPDDEMGMVLLPATAGDAATLKELEHEGEHPLEENDCTEAPEGFGPLVPAKDHCYHLVFDKEMHTSTWKIDTSKTDFVAIFTAHVPTEFERDAHYLKDSAGEDIEPIAELPEPEVVTPPWGVAIAASFLVNLVTLVGIVFLVPFFGAVATKYPDGVSVSINAFAAGALLAAAFYLMFYEATHLIKPEGSGEAVQTAFWGSACLVGFIVAYIIDLFVSLIAPDKTFTTSPDTKPDTKSTTDASYDTKDMIIAMLRQRRVVVGVVLGDFMHNFVDGIFIAYAFLACDAAKGWLITLVTIAHEIPQELADYLVLTDQSQGNLQPWKALVFNFVSGLSVILGAIVLLVQAEQNDFMMGMLLAFGGGIYLQIGAAECMPRAMSKIFNGTMQFAAIAWFILGVFLIGLVLLGHEHCAPGGHAH